MKRLDWLRGVLEVETDSCVPWPFCLDTAGYGACIDVDGRQRRPHAIVCEMTHGAAPEGLETAHSCGRRDCVNKRHLRWATPAENAADCILHGTRRPPGDGTPMNPKLPATLIGEIQSEYVAGGITQEALAQRHGVSQATISRYLRAHQPV